MSDGAGAPAAAPAAAPTTSTAPTQGAAKAPEWSDADDTEVFTRLSRAPWAKVKADGKETPIRSKDDFLALVADASRGRGANRLVEQTKKEREEATRLRSESESVLKMVQAARDGDEDAIAQLGILRPEDRRKREEEFESLSPAMREIFLENQKLKEGERIRKTEAQQREQQEKERRREAAKTETLGKAREMAKAVLKDVREELHDIELPEVISAMRNLLETGQRIGVDYSPEHLAAFVQQRRQAALNDRFAGLKPDAQLRAVLPTLKQLVSSPEGMAMLEQALGEDFDVISTPLAARRHEKWKKKRSAAAVSGGVAEPSKKEDSKAKSGPLPWGRW